VPSKFGMPSRSWLDGHRWLYGDGGAATVEA
jgi:hypothetical protein